MWTRCLWFGWTRWLSVQRVKLRAVTGSVTWRDFLPTWFMCCRTKRTIVQMVLSIAQLLSWHSDCFYSSTELWYLKLLIDWVTSIRNPRCSWGVQLRLQDTGEYHVVPSSGISEGQVSSICDDMQNLGQAGIKSWKTFGQHALIPAQRGGEVWTDTESGCRYWFWIRQQCL